jgi:hypothetical protein
MPKKLTPQEELENRVNMVVNYIYKNGIPVEYVKRNVSKTKCLIEFGLKREGKIFLTTETTQKEFDNLFREVTQIISN